MGGLAAAQRHGWNKDKLHQAGNIYQLSLRLGISFEAACWALVTWNVLAPPDAARLRATPVKALKRSLAPESYIANPWSDVWALTPADSESFLEAGPEDLFAVHVQDHASAGYVWRLVDADENVEMVGDCLSNLRRAYGTRSSRVLYLRFSSPGIHHLVFEHIRPWSGESLEHIEIDIDGHGKERAGMPRRAKFSPSGRAI